MTFYLKYRPQKIGELDLANVREALTKIIKSGNVPHAFLFSGPKGTGKTSAARILAKALNCESTSVALRGPGKIEPCNRCNQCISITRGENLDIVELDAASHRGIDDIRTLRDAVKLAPAKAKKKVYIIDEAHMLTTEASNALLKTLEEPPGHAMFILATTNPKKLIATIRSRSTSINFAKADENEIVRSLKKVIKGEKLKVEKGVSEVIARFSDGSFRDAQKLLEQLIAEKVRLTQRKVSEHLSTKKDFDINKFIEYMIEKNAGGALEEIESAVNEGLSAKDIGQSIVSNLRSAMLAKIGVGGEDMENLDKKETTQLLKLFSDASSKIPISFIEQIPLEIAVVEWCEGGKFSNDDSENENITNNNRNVSRVRNSDKKNNVGISEKVGVEKDNGSPDKSGQVSFESSVNGITDDEWHRILREIKPRNSSTEALLRAAKPVGYDGKTLQLGVFYSFHKEKLEGDPHRVLLEEVVGLVKGDNVKIECILTKPPERNVEKKTEGSLSGSNEKVIKEVVLTEPGHTGLSSKSKTDSVLTEGDDKDIIRVAKEIFGAE